MESELLAALCLMFLATIGVFIIAYRLRDIAENIAVLHLKITALTDAVDALSASKNK